MITYGLNSENRRLIVVAATKKKNGIYTFRGVLYKVNNGFVVAYAVDGQILEPCGHFDVQVGTYLNIWGSDKVARDLLKTLS